MFGAKIFADTRRYSVLGGIPFEPIPSISEKIYRGIVPKVGLHVRARARHAILRRYDRQPRRARLHRSDAGRLPAAEQRRSTFTPLAAQKAWTGEIGSRGRWDRFTWDVTFYHSELQDELLKFNTNPGAGVPATTFNAKHTMHQGVEFAASVDLLRDICGPAPATC